MLREVDEQLRGLASVLSEGLNYSLAFGDDISAHQSLKSLHQNPDILCAAAFDTQGALFASFRTDASSVSCVPATLPPRGKWRERGSTIWSSPLAMNDEHVGKLLLRISHKRYDAQFRSYLWVSLIVLIVALAIGALLVNRLIRHLVGKVGALSQATEYVLNRDDFDIQVAYDQADRGGVGGEKARVDELDDLILTFNTMLRHLRERRSAEARAWQQAGDAATAQSEATARLAAEVSERRRAQNELQRSGQELARRNRDLSDLLWAASHDLSEPVRQIQILSDLVTRADDATERLDSANRLITASGRLRELVRGLMSYAELVTTEVEFCELDPNLCVQEAIDTVIDAWPDVAITVNVEPMPHLNGDRRHFERVIFELLDNAVRFRKSDKAPVIEISSALMSRAEPDGLGPELDLCCISVKDNGIGFEQSYADKIFRVFRRLHPRYGQYSGVGLGLAVVNRVVGEHGGKVNVQSAVGVGSTFTVEFPVCRPTWTDTLVTGIALEPNSVKAASEPGDDAPSDGLGRLRTSNHEFGYE